MRVVLLTPPMLQTNTPYPATVYLTGFLSKNGYDVVQADLALELFLKIFSRQGIQEICAELDSSRLGVSSVRTGELATRLLLKNRLSYINTVEPVIRFLQGKDPSLALRICSRKFLPEGLRFMVLSATNRQEKADPAARIFASLGVQDRAHYLATLYIQDIADVIHDRIDSNFKPSSYASILVPKPSGFDGLAQALTNSNTLVDRYLDDLGCDVVRRFEPTVVGITVPFQGTVYGAFRIAKAIKKVAPEIKIALGGGYVNTDLRQLAEPRVFDYVDFITLDDGEKPLLCLLEHISGQRNIGQLCRTFVREGGRVAFKNDPINRDIPYRDSGTPSYRGLPLGSYMPNLDVVNPIVWTDYRWNKLTVAHGCYWKKCSFCDTSLDYIGRYDPASVETLIERIRTLIQETGQSGFHFVDEAAPPAVLKALAERLISEGPAITWWGNIRFEKTFTPELARLLAQSGCVRVSGGLEVASDRLLALMEKGVTVDQVARVTRAFTDAGIMVHAYLMYGFPTQTEQETIDSLEIVRQLFKAGCLQSAHWHRFSATVHSPVGMNPSRYGITILPESDTTFSRYALSFIDPTGCDHDLFGEGLEKALDTYMLGAGLDKDVRLWFDKTALLHPLPETTVPSDLIERALRCALSGPHAAV